MLATLLRITRWTLDRGVWVRALTGSFRFIAGKENEMLGDNLRWSSFLYFALWLVLKTCATFSTNQIQAKTNNDLVACVFPRFR